MKYADIDVIVWDLDGTIINSFGLFTEILKDAVQKTGHTMPSYEVMFRNFHGTLGETIENIMEGLSTAEHDEIFAAFLDAQPRHYENIDHIVMEDAVKLVKRAQSKGIRQMVVTNRADRGRDTASPVYIIESIGLGQAIDTIISADTSEFRKPDTALFEGALPHGNILVVGDQFVDAKFAQNLNGRAVLVNRHPEDIVHLDRLGPNWEETVTIVQSLDDIELF